MNDLEDIAGKACFEEDLLDPLADEGSLGRGLEDDGVSCEKGGDERVDEDEIRELGYT